ncbi:uncharacterized protein [Halyomorpha halys]|uniref:uncharacterized protein n=1 Tax=Halyomorpha halys TaxID=286706 RepID=UPI0006D4EB37|nr:uncharacterized protein LOC106678174 [Halyomorpha halys]
MLSSSMDYLKKFTYVFIVWIFVILKCEAGREWIHRNPRYLPFPMGIGNKLQIIAGFGIPVEIASDSLTFGYIIKTNYALPTNASQFTNPDEAFADFSKKRMRWSFYEVMINLFTSLSLGGRDCLLRSICEAAYTPLGHNGVLGEILHIILTPSSTVNEITDDSEDYTKAEETGRSSTTHDYCSKKFSNCTLSLLDIISKIDGSLLDDKFLQNMKWLK